MPWHDWVGLAVVCFLGWLVFCFLVGWAIERMMPDDEADHSG